MAGFDANSLFTMSNGQKVLGNSGSKGAFYVANTRFNDCGLLEPGPQWEGTVDPYPTSFSLSAPSPCPPSNGTPGCYPTHKPTMTEGLALITAGLTIALQDLATSNGTACPPTHYKPLSQFPDPVYKPSCPPPIPCTPVASNPPPPSTMPVPCPPPVSPSPVPPSPVPCPPSRPMPCPPSIPTPCPSASGHYYPPMMPMPGNCPPTSNRQYKLNKLLDMARRLLMTNDQGLPLNESLPSPFGHGYMSPWQSPYSNVDPFNDGVSTQPSAYQPGYGHPTMDQNNASSNWLKTMLTPDNLSQAKTSAIYPPITGTTDLLGRTGAFPTLNSLLQRGGLAPTLAGIERQGALIVFAPTEKAFQRLQQTNPRLVQQLQDPRNVNILNEILKYHVSQASRGGFQFPANNVAIDSLTARDAIRYNGNAFQGTIVNGNQSVTTGRALQLPNTTLIVPIDDVLIPPGLDLSCLY